MPRGGKRPGAGRKRGTLGKKTAAIAAVVVATGISPLEVLCNAMRYHYELALESPGEISIDEDGHLIAAPKGYHYGFAAEYARHAAPYIHPRLNAIEHTGKDGGVIKHEIDDSERVKRLAALLARAKSRMPEEAPSAPKKRAR